jgi:hypothetical protein
MAVKNKRFAASRGDYLPLSKKDLEKAKKTKFYRYIYYEGKPAIILGLFFFLIGLAITVNILFFYTARLMSQ